MPELESKTFLRVPTHRIVDAAPIACIAILLCFFPRPRFTDVVMPTSLASLAVLQIWLWLRFPRNFARYLIALAVVLAIYFISHGNPVDAITDTLGMFKTGKISRLTSQVIVALSATAVLPIAYRLLSRCSLHCDRDETASKVKPRGSIFDIMVLSLFCAYLFFAVRQGTEGSDRDLHDSVRTMWDSCLYSIIGLVCMRLFSGIRGVAIVPLFVTVVLTTAALMVVADELDSVLWYDRTWFRYFGLDDAVITILFACLFPAFAILNQYCGVRLSKTNDAKSLAATSLEQSEGKEQLAAPADGESPPAKPSIALSALTWMGRLIVGFLLLLIFLSPVLADKSEAEATFLAGWPLDYGSHVAYRDGTSGPHFFSPIRFVADLLLCFAALLMLLAPRWVFSSATAKQVTAIRLITLLLLCGGAVYLSIVRPQMNDAKIDQLNVRYSRGFKTSFVDLVSSVVEDSVLPWSSRPRRLQVIKSDFKDLDQEQTETVCSFRYLREASFERCHFSEKALKKLSRLPQIQKLGFINCKIDGSVAEIVESMPNLTHITPPESELADKRLLNPRFSSYQTELKLTADYRSDLEIPSAVEELTIVVPNQSGYDGRGLTLEIANKPRLKKLVVHNTVAYIPDNIHKVVLSGLPQLSEIVLDNCQKLDIEIHDAPLLEKIHNIHPPEDREMITVEDRYRQMTARLTRLKVTGDHSLNHIRFDLSDCETIEIEKENDASGTIRDDESTLVIYGREFRGTGSNSTLSAMTTQQAVKNLNFGQQNLRFAGVQIDSSVVTALREFPVRSLTLQDVSITEDAFDGVSGFERLQQLDAVDAALSDQQLSDLIGGNSTINRLRIDGSRLTKIPANANVSGPIVLLNAKGLDEISEWTLTNSKGVVALSTEKLAEIGPNRDYTQFRNATGAIMLGGRIVDAASIKAIQQRLKNQSDETPTRMISLVDPDIEAASLTDFDWGELEFLVLENAPLNPEVVRSWKMNQLSGLALTSKNLSEELVQGIVDVGAQLQFLKLDHKGSNAAIPSWSNLAISRLMKVHLVNCHLNKTDIDRLHVGSPATLMLTNCTLTPAAIDRLYLVQATGGPPQIAWDQATDAHIESVSEKNDDAAR